MKRIIYILEVIVLTINTLNAQTDLKVFQEDVQQCFAVKDKIFFSLGRVITAPDVVLVTHIETEGHRHV